MTTQKSDIEKIRYQLKKLGLTASNDEIRLAINNFEGDFDPVSIAQTIVNQNSLSIQNNNSENDFLALLPDDSKTLSVAKKQELIQIKSQELGIELSSSDISKIADMATIQINDSIEYLDAIAIIIQEYFRNRNIEAENIIDEKIQNITSIINSENKYLGDVFNVANRKIDSLIEDCNSQKTDYKSSYKSKIKDIREMLKLSK